MIRSLHRPVLRALGALSSVLLLLVQLADGTGVHRCPAHDGVGIVPATMPHHAGMEHHAGPPADHQHHGPCTCLGACHGASLALAAADGTPRLTIDVRATALLVVLAGTVPLPRPRLLPFANGPPRLVPSRFT
ncbi:MAG: hypothetical protein ABI587_11930 [Gemmatimonadales bacterium]